LFLPYFRYFNPTFHPWKIDNFSLIHHWKTAFSMEHDPAKIVEILKIKA
jgi:predicted metal-dependent hydrolase